MIILLNIHDVIHYIITSTNLLSFQKYIIRLMITIISIHFHFIYYIPTTVSKTDFFFFVGTYSIYGHDYIGGD